MDECQPLPRMSTARESPTLALIIRSSRIITVVHVLPDHHPGPRCTMSSQSGSTQSGRLCTETKQSGTTQSCAL